MLVDGPIPSPQKVPVSAYFYWDSLKATSVKKCLAIFLRQHLKLQFRLTSLTSAFRPDSGPLARYSSIQESPKDAEKL